MYPFTYAPARDERQILALLGANSRARAVAGGTTLLDLMKLNVERPTHIVDINALPWTTVESLASGGVRIGSMVRNSDLAAHELIRVRYPLLSQALLAGASPQIRNMATTGGNLLQRTRCPYFRDTAMACNKREPGSGCAAIHGYNRGHAILGVSEQCIATHPSDMAVALTAIDAVVHVRGSSGDRAISIEDFFVLPGDRPDREHTLRQGELITTVDLPALPFATRSLYLKIRDRSSYAFALASAAVALDVRDGTIRAARIALGGVGTKPWRATAAEHALVGRPPGSAAYSAAGAAAIVGAAPRRDNAFKVELAKQTLMRALARAGAMA